MRRRDGRRRNHHRRQSAPNGRVASGRDPVRVDSTPSSAPREARGFRQRSAAARPPGHHARKSLACPRAISGPRRRGNRVRDPRRSLELDRLMREFGRRGWCSVLIEGGANLAAAALSAGIVDRVVFFVAPRTFGAGCRRSKGMKSPDRARRDRARQSFRRARSAAIGCWKPGRSKGRPCAGAEAANIVGEAANRVIGRTG